MSLQVVFLYVLQMTKIEIPDAMVQFSDEELEAQRMLMWQCFSQFITPSIQCVVEFAKRVPGTVNFLKFRTLYFILFWPKFCFLHSCFLKYFMEWQTVYTLIRLLLSALLAFAILSETYI